MKIKKYFLLLILCISFSVFHNSLSAKEKYYINPELQELKSIVELQLNIMNMYATASNYDNLNNKTVFSSGLLPKSMSYNQTNFDEITTKNLAKIMVVKNDLNNQQFDIVYTTNNSILLKLMINHSKFIKLGLFSRITIHDFKDSYYTIFANREDMKTDVVITFTSFSKK